MNVHKIHLNFTEELKKVFDIILSNNGECRIIGGCVRDYLIGKTPIDFDIATTLTPEDITKIFNKNNIKVFPIGIEHGTVLVVINNSNFEITTLRKDVKCYGRHAKVEFTNDWKIDAARRDFTINAMSISQDGKLYDYFNGQEDLAHRKVKFIGNPIQRIKEDYLRTLRYIRFLGYFGLKNIDHDSYKVSIENIKNLKHVSKERIKKELIKLLGSKFVKDTLIQLNKENVLKFIGLSQVIVKQEILKNINFKIGDPLVNLAILVNVSEIQTKDKVKILKEELLLSNKEFQEVNSLTSFDSQKEFNDYYHYKYLYEFGKNMYLRFLFVVNNFRKVIEYDRFFNEALRDNDFIFPINGRDLQKLNIKDKAIGKYIEKGKSHWHKNKNNLNKVELIEYIKSIT
ncbi:CCA tRNA nucleotidyltransferase [Rickettsiales endosymbiont of Trichoplax sp. H2]|uniref:CCA tRNA nucleotidyltransferase n=1 Tax=Rickettsiales endosymbiont of Trichoplax sp. H2 TaxID=2021221 RepID=UPI0012B23ABD|nr:CCA tRNA nucleotidyltransferase [Rickettsiales endosymbiont of Trichoplax sp. H2]MSO13809.1 CCA tRNA nucleotidyltransferase 1, mitochondrial [Rickettsiales endosymbiont of Trichoplax sp. H2]